MPGDLDCETTIQPYEMSIIEEEYKLDDKLITKEASKEVAINEGEINTYAFSFIYCSTIVFLTKPEEERSLYFESDGIGKSYHIEWGEVKNWKIN